MLKPPHLDTSHTKFNRERQMVPGLFKPLAQVSKLRIGKDLVFTKVSLGTKVISYAVAGVMGKVVKPQVQRFQKLGGGRTLLPWCGSQVSSSLYLPYIFRRKLQLR
jgi:hypothetical protein